MNFDLHYFVISLTDRRNNIKTSLQGHDNKPSSQLFLAPWSAADFELSTKQSEINKQEKLTDSDRPVITIDEDKTQNKLPYISGVAQAGVAYIVQCTHTVHISTLYSFIYLLHTTHWFWSVGTYQSGSRTLPGPSYRAVAVHRRTDMTSVPRRRSSPSSSSQATCRVSSRPEPTGSPMSCADRCLVNRRHLAERRQQIPR